MKTCPKSIRFSIAVSALLSALLLASCGDDNFTPIARPSADQDEELSSSSRGSSSSEDEDISSSSRSSSSYSSSSYSSSSSISSSSSSSSSSYRANTSSSWYNHNLSSSATREKTYEYCDDYSVNWPDTKDDIFNPNIEYGTMTDPRDGKTYRTVEVLGQIWMAENLNFADSANFPLLKGNTFCYEDDEEKCNILGRLYKRQAAMYTEKCYNDADSFCNTGDEPVQGICPDGWHLPSAEDVWELIDLEKGDARAFMSAYGWISGEEAVLPGENTYGLSFVGNYFKTLSKCGTMSGLGMYAIMWVSNYGLYHHYMVIQGQENHIILLEYETGSLERGVRCIKDE